MRKGRRERIEKGKDTKKFEDKTLGRALDPRANGAR